MSTHNVPRLGRLEQVPLKDVWSSEPFAFDPWLSQPENLQFLAESLGLPGLELVQAQHPIGPFYADLVCRILDTETIVLVENQRRSTNGWPNAWCSSTRYSRSTSSG